MLDFKQEINKYKQVRTTEDVSGDITNDVQDILDLLKQVSSRPTVVKTAPKPASASPGTVVKPTSASPGTVAKPTNASSTTVTKPIVSIVPKQTHASENDESTSTMD